MIKIVKDKDIKEVTKGVYESVYKPLGYQVYGEQKPIKTGIEEKIEVKDNEIKEVNKKNDFKEVFDKVGKSSNKEKSDR